MLLLFRNNCSATVSLKKKTCTVREGRRGIEGGTPFIIHVYIYITLSPEMVFETSVTNCRKALYYHECLGNTARGMLAVLEVF